MYSIQVCGRTVKFEGAWDLSVQRYVIRPPDDSGVARRIKEVLVGKKAQEAGVSYVDKNDIYLNRRKGETLHSACQRVLALISDD